MRSSTESPAADQPSSTDSEGGALRRGGRPTRADAEQLRERILDAATELFLANGYGATSIEAVVQRAKISKRTFYHRFDDKPVLFGAVVHRIIGGLRPPSDAPLLDGANLRDILQHLAAIILRAALAPEAIALHRLIVAESGRFPDLAAIVAREGAMEEAVRLIAGLLQRQARAGAFALRAPIFAAQQFLYMVIALPQRRAMGMGLPMTSDELDAWARDVVHLFLNGVATETSND
jgi:TetR/AcrR family transcriptional regulator, mexJK operon transcriptional repressor